MTNQNAKYAAIYAVLTFGLSVTNTISAIVTHNTMLTTFILASTCYLFGCSTVVYVVQKNVLRGIKIFLLLLMTAVVGTVTTAVFTIGQNNFVQVIQCASACAHMLYLLYQYWGYLQTAEQVTNQVADYMEWKQRGAKSPV